jgi:hypothetical protein
MQIIIDKFNQDYNNLEDLNKEDKDQSKDHLIILILNIESRTWDKGMIECK